MKKKTKICGMRHPENIRQVLALQPDFLGFIFYNKSPRNVSEEEMKAITALDFGKTEKVAVFVNESNEKILSICNDFGFNYVQLHGSESVEQISELQQKGLKVIKAISVGDALPENWKNYDEVADYLLFDTKGKQAGGNGFSFDWSILETVEIKSPYFLSGGLEEDSLQQLQSSKLTPFVLDFNSKLEIEPGLKDIEKVKQVLN